MKLLFLLAMALVMFLAGCGQASVTPVATRAPAVTAVPLSEVITTPRQLPTLYPTATPFPPATVAPTQPPQPTAVPTTPIAFDQVVVDLHYRLPALGLDRRLQGDVSGRLTMEDRAAGLSLVRENQSRILLEMQQGIAHLTLAELPDDCPHCVWMAYDLPLSGMADSGWLEDVTLLASLDNFTAIHLGPHVPPDTWIALRRSATSYWVAHAVAVTTDGRVWRWLATEGRIAEPLSLGAEMDRFQAALAALEELELADAYTTPCLDAARETLFLPGSSEDGTIRIICPALSLPAPLLPLYLELDALLAESLAGKPAPPEPLSLTTLLHYQPAGDERLLIAYDNQAVVERGGEVYTDTLPASQVISLTTGLEQSGFLRLAPDDVLAAGPGVNALIVRGAGGVSGATWSSTPPDEVAAFITELDRLVAQLAGQAPETPGGPTPAATTTPVPGVTGTPPAPTGTATPTP
jgi:hypothetical protein